MIWTRLSVHNKRGLSFRIIILKEVQGSEYRSFENRMKRNFSPDEGANAMCEAFLRLIMKINASYANAPALFNTASGLGFRG
jgi:hypothetical protein